MGTIDLNDLGVFVAVVESASFSAAATRLGLPKSSVSRAISRLEEAMGMRLLHRTTRRVTTSTAGKALFDKVVPEIASLRDSVAEVPELAEEPSGRLRITVVADMNDYLADVVARFARRYRAIEVEVRLTNDYVDLVAEGIDLALRFATKPFKDSSLTARKLGPSTVQLYAAPTYLARKGAPTTPRELDQHEWAVYLRAPKFVLQSGKRSEVVTMKGRVSCDNLEFLRASIVSGVGLGYLSPVHAENDVATGRLVRVLPAWSCHISDLWGVWPGGRRLPRKVSAFLDFLSDALGTRPIG